MEAHRIWVEGLQREVRLRVDRSGYSRPSESALRRVQNLASFARGQVPRWMKEARQGAPEALAKKILFVSRSVFFLRSGLKVSRPLPLARAIVAS